MNKYEKKKNYAQALLEFESVKTVLVTIAVIAGACAMTFVGHLLLMTPLFELNDESSWAERRFDEFLIGSSVFLLGFLIVIGIETISEVIETIRTNLHAAKIIQYLPLTKEDWKAWNVKTNKEAVDVLRELVHSFGYSDDFCYCSALKNNIWRSYRSFLEFVYGDDDDRRRWNELSHIEDIVLCLDEDFEQTLKDSLDKRENWRQAWEQKYGPVPDSVKRNADTSV